MRGRVATVTLTLALGTLAASAVPAGAEPPGTHL